MKEDKTTQPEVRSSPLKSTYNSTSVVVIVVIALVLGTILFFWPFGGL